METDPPELPVAKFQTGDLVKLKSGSPVMTINTPDINPDSLSPGRTIAVVAHWFAGANHYTATFDEGTLEPASVKKD